MSILYGVGVGPGDPQLLTLKAAKIIENCGVIAVPQTKAVSEPQDLLALTIASGAVDMQGKEILPLYMPMTKNKTQLTASHEAAALVLMQRLDKGQSVAFLTLGDPSIYSTYLYLHHIITAKGYQAEIIPGIPSFCAAAAALGTDLCLGPQQLHIIPGTYGGNITAYPGTTVLMKTGKALPKIKAQLAAEGQLENAFLVHKCTMTGQRILPLKDADENAGYFSLIIIKKQGDKTND